MDEAGSPNEPLKRRRITRACDRCHRSGVKCSAGPNPSMCGPCAAFGSECTYLRPVKRRGPVPRSLHARSSSNPNNNNTTANNGSASIIPPHTSDSTSHHSGDDTWTPDIVGGHQAIHTLTEAFHRIVYPILCYFHWPTFQAGIRARRYDYDRPFYALTMAVCAMSAARLRDGAGGADSDGFGRAALPPYTPPPEAFYQAAVRAFPRDLWQAPEFDYKRAKAVLAILCVQFGQVRQLITHLGDYLTLCACDNFHNEARWPPNLSPIEVQERRRLYWAAYKAEVYAATTWGGTVRHREAESNVQYPAEVLDDNEITETGIIRRNDTTKVSWFVGWNFTTDMYRILEHAITQLRKKRKDPNRLISRLYELRIDPQSSDTTEVVNALYLELPPEFKGAKAMTGHLDQDRYGYMAADIIVTMQTVRMVVVGLEEDNDSVEKRCAIAGELLDALSAVPTAYIQAISSPILHHLAGVGHLLGGVIQSPLSQWSYLQVRNVLLAMADLLSSLEASLSVAPGIADKLRDHVSRIDQYMTAAALDHSRQAQVYHNALPPSAWTSVGPQKPGSAVSPEVFGVGMQVADPSVTSQPGLTPHSQDMLDATSLSTQGHTPGQGPSPDMGILPPDAQVVLPTDLVVDWLPFDFGEAFNFLSAT